MVDLFPDYVTITIACGRTRQSCAADARRYGLYGVSGNKINPRKLLNSKWTAVMPTKKEKHFMVTEIEFSEEGIVVLCAIEALISKRSIPINWHDLKDDRNWVHGWK